MTSLDGKVAVVTGASRGIGRAIADRLETEGARVARVARFGTEGDVAGDGFPCDVTNEADVARMAVAVRERLGPPDIVVNNAGLFLFRPFAETTADDLRRQLEVNIVGVFLVCKAFVGELVDRRGILITVGSVADHLAFPGNAAYAASKFGVRGLHEVLAAEYRGAGLRTTLISPAATDTHAWDPVDPDGRDDLPDRAAMLRPQDVADAVAFAATRPARATVELLRLNPSA